LLNPKKNKMQPFFSPFGHHWIPQKKLATYYSWHLFTIPKSHGKKTCITLLLFFWSLPNPKKKHCNITIKFDLNNVPKICHFKSSRESFMSCSNAKSIRYIAKTMFLDIWYSLNLFQTFSSVSIMYYKHFCIHLPNILNIDLT
jgi:hypothetical protein